MNDAALLDPALATGTAVLRAVGLCKTFRQGDTEVEVFTGVNLEVPRGRRVAIVGASGSGKSTLLHLLGGLEAPTTGTVLLAGRNLASLNPAEQGEWRNRHLGFVYQFHHLLPEFTALENVEMPLRIARVPAREARPYTILETNLSQTAASSAAAVSSAGLVAAIPALTVLTGLVLPWWKLSLWVFSVCIVGIVLAVPLRRQMLVNEPLPFPFGIATAETLKQMYAKGAEAMASFMKEFERKNG